MTSDDSRREFLKKTAGLNLGLPLLVRLSTEEANAPVLPTQAAGLAPTPLAEDLPPRTVITSVPPRPVPEWVKTHLRRSHLPPPDWNQIDAHLKAGVTSLCVNMNDLFSVVGPSAVLYSPEVVHKADETMRRFVERVHRAGAKALFYIGPLHVANSHPEFLQAHPDWVVVDAGGKPTTLGNFHSGYGDWLAGQLAYVVRTYRCDGFWFDGYSGWMYSHDETSRRLFRAYSGGKEIPAHPDPRSPVGMQFLQWFWKGYVAFADRLRSVIRRENPDAVLYANYSANREWYLPNNPLVEYPAPYANAVDVPSLEQYWDTPGDALNQQELAAFMEGVTHNRGSAVWMQPSAFGTVGLSPPVEFRLRYLVGATRGVYCEFVEPTGREEYLTQWISDIKSREAWMQKSEPLPWIGLVASEQTKMLYGGNAPLANYFAHTLGAFRALMEAHRPVNILTEYDLEDNHLEGIRVLALANVACLSDRAAEVIRRFVRQGGGLVATYQSSLFDHTGAQRGDFALADLFHASYQRALPVRTRDDALPLYITSHHPITEDALFAGSEWTSWIPKGSPRYGEMMMLGDAAQVQARSGSEQIVAFGEKMASPNRWPAALVSPFGKGRVVYFPAGIDKAMFFYPAGYLRALLRNAYDWAAHASPPVEVQAPLILATTFRAQPDKNRIIVHLLNDASSWGRHSIYQKIAPHAQEYADPGHPQSPDLRGTWAVREEVIPIHDIKVTCRRAGIKRATLQPENLKLPLTRVAGGVQVTVPRVELHSMVVFE